MRPRAETAARGRSAARGGSSRPRRALASLEHWMQARIVAPHERGSPLRTLRATSKELLEPSATLAADERVAIYANMYGWRMHDALAEDFPALRALLGDERFEKLVRAYLMRFPSRNASLNGLGANLPRFLETARVKRRALMRDVAAVELAITRSMLAPNAEPVSRERAARIAPEAWNGARFELAPHVRLLELRHRANEIVTAARQDKPPPSLARRATNVVVWRKGWTIWRKDLETGPFAALSALARGRTLASATRAAERAHRGDPAALSRALERALAEWLVEGFFTGIDARG